jgi:hypothetical protein
VATRQVPQLPAGKHLVDITITNNNGTTHTLTATNRHPFWVESQKRWTTAEDLHPGHLLRTPTGTHTPITTTRHHTTHTRVHNLTIANAHTYHALAGNTSILVHNCNFRVGVGDEKYDKHVLGLDDAGNAVLTPDMPEYDYEGGFERYVADAQALMCGPCPLGAREVRRDYDGAILRMDIKGRLGIRVGKEIATYFRPDDGLEYLDREGWR